MSNLSSETMSRMSVINAENFQQVGTHFEYLADVRMNKGGRSHDNVLYGHIVQQLLVYSGWIPFIDYANALANRSGVDAEKVREMLGKCWHKKYDQDAKYAVDKRTESKAYILVQRSEKQGVIAHVKYLDYYVDGRKATDAEVAMIKKYEIKSTPSTSSTQTALGITNHQLVNTLNVDNIICMSQKAKVVRF